MDNGARTHEEKHVGLQILLHQIDSYARAASRDDAHAEIVDGERRFVLLDDHQEHVGAAVKHSQLAVDEGVFHDLAKVGIVNALHARVVHQFRFFHRLHLIRCKDNKNYGYDVLFVWKSNKKNISFVIWVVNH